MDAKSLFLTANADTYYLWSYLDLTKGPLVVETPPETLGIIRRHVVELGLRFRLPRTPTADTAESTCCCHLDTTGDVPEGGFYVRRSRTNHVSLPRPRVPPEQRSQAGG